MEIKVITAFMAHGKRVEAGEVIDLPVADAAYAVSLKRAEYIEAEATEPKAKAARVPKAKAARVPKAKAE